MAAQAGHIYGEGVVIQNRILPPKRADQRIAGDNFALMLEQNLQNAKLVLGQFQLFALIMQAGAFQIQHGAAHGKGRARLCPKRIGAPQKGLHFGHCHR